MPNRVDHTKQESEILKMFVLSLNAYFATTDILKSGRRHTMCMDKDGLQQKLADISEGIGANERKLAELQRELARLENDRS
jgi:hypothetical protein